MLPPYIADALRARFGTLAETTSIHGGETSEAARVRLTDGRELFVKFGRGNVALSYYAEIDGLLALRAAAPPGIEVPEIWLFQLSDPETLSVPGANEYGFIVLPWLKIRPATEAGWRSFGESLAELHRAPTDLDGYGWTSDNWLGRAPQDNTPDINWATFYAERRFGSLTEVVRAQGRWRVAWDAPLARPLARLPEILPARPQPSLVHGDLWRGNALSLADGRTALIDPAVYVGHREVDLALAELFGGFAESFFEAYRRTWPLDSGYAERRDVYQLYHLIMHLLVPGGDYAAAVDCSLRRFA